MVDRRATAERRVRSARERDPETPYMVIYTSGTTGRPKGAVHVHGGFPIKAAQDLAHTFDLGRGDTLFWFTDLGWMMGPWAIAGSLLLGARLVLYEGAPDFPGPDRLWSIVARHRVTHLGLSPTVIRALMAHGEEPVRAHDRSSLRVLGSTGEPWNPEPWWWYFREVGEGRCPIVNYRGGTEVGGRDRRRQRGRADQAGVVLRAVHRDGGRRRRRGRAPVRGARSASSSSARRMPGMTRGFWGDRGALRGDVLVALARAVGSTATGRRIDEDGFWYIHGRSDDTLKVAGKRVGPAEVESAAVAHPAVARGGRDRRPARDQGRGRSSCCASSDPARPTTTALRAAIAATGRGASSASRSSPRSWPSSGPCPRPAPARSCAGSSGPPGWASTRATSRRLDDPRPLDAIRAAAAASSTMTVDEEVDLALGDAPAGDRRPERGDAAVGRRPRRRPGQSGDEVGTDGAVQVVELEPSAGAGWTDAEGDDVAATGSLSSSRSGIGADRAASRSVRSQVRARRGPR